MGVFTLHRLASLQAWFAITAFFEFCYVIGLIDQQFACESNGPRQKGEVEEVEGSWIPSSRCHSDANDTIDKKTNPALSSSQTSRKFLLDCGNSSDVSEWRYYVNNQMLWFFLLLSAILSGLLWAGFQVTRNPKLANGKRPNDSQSTSKNSGFTCAATLGYLFISFLYLILQFVWFQFTLSGGRFASFGIDWLQNFSDGKPLLARQITCELRQCPLSEPVTTMPATCKLPMNSHFEFVYLVHWFSFVLLAVFNLLVLVQCLLYTFSSTLRFRRLSALLKGVDKQKISKLAQDADAFFKIECWAGETVELKGQQLMDVAARN